ncbi:MAG: hypothetical protein MUE50_14360 [Pirellulaceae bacterium]|nr:hypothetical protein [Pirellulaceae bacterium]
MQTACSTNRLQPSVAVLGAVGPVSRTAMIFKHRQIELLALLPLAAIATPSAWAEDPNPAPWRKPLA